MDVHGLVDAEVAAALAAMPRFAELSDAMLAVLREQRVADARQLSAQLPGRVSRTDHTVPGAAGHPEVVLRVYRAVDADPAAALPCVYWVHGGGYVLGTYEGEDGRFEAWCPRHGCVGVSVEYRLAPETAYPGPLEDCYAGLRWVHANAAALGIDPGRIGIGGSSAGGGLAAALALLARDRAEVPLRFQLLVYPMIDDRFGNPSHHWEVPVWPPSSNRYGWRAYLGDRFGSDDVPAYAAPSRATDLAGLPATFLTVGTLDGFVDEDVDYAARLNRAGVPVELHLHPGAPHGFELFAPHAAVSKRARAEMNDWLARVL
jgi:acetyl esterase/lipase